jgi:hypothetical protein
MSSGHHTVAGSTHVLLAIAPLIKQHAYAIL